MAITKSRFYRRAGPAPTIANALATGDRRQRQARTAGSRDPQGGARTRHGVKKTAAAAAVAGAVQSQADLPGDEG
jgi:hypothetical protein